MNRRKIGLVLLVSAMFFLLAGCGKKKVDLSEYVVVTYTGIDGKATANVAMDFDAMADILIDEKASDSENAARLLGLSATISCKADKTEGLSNGDEIEVKVRWNGDVAEKYGLEFSAEPKVFTVSGLEEGVVLDLFADMQVTYREIAPLAIMEIRNGSEDEFLSDVRYYVENGPDTVKNGDVITVKAKYNESEAEEAGYIMKETEKTITVEGLDEYMKEYAQLDEATFEQIKAQADDLIDAAFADPNFQYLWYYYPGQMIAYNSEVVPEMSEPKLSHAYFLYMKDGVFRGFSDPYNKLYLVYTLHTVDGLTPEGKDAYLMVSIDNLVVKGTGEMEVAVMSARIENMKYDNFEYLYKDVVTAHKDKYTCEEIAYN